MADASFTPGPWTATHNGHYWQIDSDTHGQIGDACSSNTIYIGGKELSRDKARPIAAANARLMAAAPELLAALVDLCDAWEHNGGTFKGNVTKSTAAARAVIAKAEAAS